MNALRTDRPKMLPPGAAPHLRPRDRTGDDRQGPFALEGLRTGVRHRRAPEPAHSWCGGKPAPGHRLARTYASRSIEYSSDQSEASASEPVPPYFTMTLTLQVRKVP